MPEDPPEPSPGGSSPVRARACVVTLVLLILLFFEAWALFLIYVLGD